MLLYHKLTIYCILYRTRLRFLLHFLEPYNSTLPMTTSTMSLGPPELDGGTLDWYSNVTIICGQNWFNTYDGDFLRPYQFIGLLSQMVSLLVLSDGSIEIFSWTNKRWRSVCIWLINMHDWRSFILWGILSVSLSSCSIFFTHVKPDGCCVILFDGSCFSSWGHSQIMVFAKCSEMCNLKLQ